MLQSTVGLSST